MMEVGAINEADAMGRYMKLIRKKKNSYSKEKQMAVGSKAFSMDPQRKAELTREAIRKTQEYMNNSGVSSDLANQLEDMSNQ
jgi:alcohol dehydrogenase YqhD (iron-dependent ADH family)